jgi:hypothetical protein
MNSDMLCREEMAMMADGGRQAIGMSPKVQVWMDWSMKSDVARSCSEELELGSRWRDIRG